MTAEHALRDDGALRTGSPDDGSPDDGSPDDGERDDGERDAPGEQEPDKARARPPLERLTLDRLGPAIVFTIALVVYVRTLMPGVAFGDYAEMQTVPYVLGVAHPTGYPIYVLLGWLWDFLPIGSVAFRATMLAAVYVAGALATSCAIAQRLHVRPVIAIGASLAAGAAGSVWAAATVSDAQALHLFLTALSIHRALVWSDTRRTRDLALGGLFVGMALGNHLLTIFIAPFVVIFVLWAGRREILARPWILLAPLAAGAVALSSYLYIIWAAHTSTPLQYNHPTDLAGLYWLATGVQFHGDFGFLSASGPGTFLASLGDLWALAVDRATFVVPTLGIVGLLLLCWKRTAYGLLLLVLLVFGGYIWANYLRLEHYLVVPFLLLGIGMAFSLEMAARGVERLEPSIGWDLAPAVGVVAVVFGLALGMNNWAANDRSSDHSGDEYVSAVLNGLPPNAAILGIWDASTPLWYGRYVLGMRPDVLVVDDTNIVYEHWGTRENRIASLICQRPVFMIRLGEGELGPTRALYDLTPFMTVNVAWGGPSAAAPQTVWQVNARPGTCGS